MSMRDTQGGHSAEPSIDPASIDAWPGAEAGLPDPQLIAAWANEFFRAGALPAAAAQDSPRGSPPTQGATLPLLDGSPAEAVAPASTLVGDPLAAAPLVTPGFAALTTPPINGPSLSSAAAPVTHAPVAMPIAAPGLSPSGATEPALASPLTTMPFGAPGISSAASPLVLQPLGTPGLSTFASAPHAAPATATSAPGLRLPLASAPASFYFLDHHSAGAPEAESPGLQRVETPAAGQLRSPAAHEVHATPAPAAASPAYSTELKQAPSLGVPVFDPLSIRSDFPILDERVNGKRLVWLDNAATTQKPRSVIERLSHFYAHENSNVHRGAHTLAARSSDAYEAAREKVRRFINAPSAQDIVFLRGTTEAINLVAQSWGRRYLRKDDEIVITWLEHHSNIVPWQLLCAETGAKLRVAPIDDDGQVVLEAYERLCGPRTRLVSFAQVSNALGTITPAREMIEIAQRYGARVLVDGAQAVSHLRVDVQALDCDFYALSGHKVFGPTGIGVLYGKSELLNAMPPWQGGGNMIADVSFDKTVYHAAPMRFEAGTGNIADAVGLGEALDYLERVGLENVTRYEHELLAYGTQRLLEVRRLRLIGTAKQKAGVLGFVIDGVPSEQVGAALAREGIAVRAGHHCAQPAVRRFGLESTVRPSLALYNTREDIDALVGALHELQAGW